ncbi:guanylate-binding protein 1-like [Megalops cyprinoides]|uniref:guanylate-binding protein 1-like n=1 Tax=Megalops cyprinoides TaxID=118141 RepID=UPI0018650764|nr:guanylate-binding protein 1-like [Megalops cyprinoides]
MDESKGPQGYHQTEGGSVKMPQPVCLIANESGSKLQVNQEALNILSSIKQPVVVVAIVGMYRTGKSYLMNRLAGKRTGFSLGSTIQSETKGIWMWCVPHPCRENHTLVLLDTEGLGDVEKGDQTNDTWIFALAVLLSSTLVYNSIGTINNEALMSLHYVTELTKHIKVKSSQEAESEASFEFIRYFPSFVWTVRDFTLDLELDGRAITSDEYLENSLKLKPSKSPVFKTFNGPRECIRKYFPLRKCFVFDQPATKRKLKKMEELSDADLEPDFIKQTKDFCSYILSHSKEKSLTGGITVNGSMLANLVVTYMDAICGGQMPCLENAVLALSQIENSAAVEKSHALYRQLLGEQVKLPTETQEELSSVHEGCLKEALQLFMARSFKDEDQLYQEDLMERIKEVYEEKCQENADLSRKHCITLLQQLWESLDQESYMRPGGYADYRVQVDSIIQQYRDTPGKGIQGDHALEAFLKEKSDLGRNILMADKSLTEKQQNLEAEKARAEMERFKAEVARQEQEAMAQKMENMERAHRENERQLLEKMEKENKAMMEENERVLTQRLEEQKALIKEGYEQKANEMEAQIKSLQQRVASSGSTCRRRRRRRGCVIS